MKAYMDENGNIHLSPESSVEAFALKRFAGELMTLDGQEVYPARKLIVEKDICPLRRRVGDRLLEAA